MLKRRDLIAQSLAASAVASISSPRAGYAVPADGGSWSAPFPAAPTVSIHLSLLPTSNHERARLLSYGGVEKNPATGDKSSWTRTYVLDIPTDQVVVSSAIQANNTDTTLFCGGHTFLHDGRLITMGGQVNALYNGAADVCYFEAEPSFRWSKAAAAESRWYPSLCTLPDGQVTVLSGTTTGQGQRNPLPQVWDPTAGTIRNLTSALRAVALYPKIFVAPDGRVVMVGPERLTRFLDTNGLGKWSEGPNSIQGQRNYGMAVMYDHGKIMIAGGAPKNNAEPTKTVEILDLGASRPAWRSGAQPMFHARKHANSTMLPDGTILVTGGTNSAGFNDPTGAVYAAELWNPATETWTLMASAQVLRIYHSTALLLPDGRVLSAGGTTATNGGPSGSRVAEIFSPPYLFRGSRPVVTAAAGTAALGSTFAFESPDAASIRAVNLLSIGSTTHTFNMNQRINRLSFTSSGTTVTARLDSDRTRQLPGYYMMFALNADGVPSIGRMIRVTAA